MGYYEQSREAMADKANEIFQDVRYGFENLHFKDIKKHFGDQDLFIRKVVSKYVGKFYSTDEETDKVIINMLKTFFRESNQYTRQAVMFACSEIGVADFPKIKRFLEDGLEDEDPTVRTCVSEALQNIVLNNYEEGMKFCRKHIQSSQPEIRKLIVHGLEFRGREHPEDVLPLLKTLEEEPYAEVQEMMIHVLGQISYRENCLFFVAPQVKQWKNKRIYPLYKKEVIEVHKRYKRYSYFSPEKAKQYLNSL